MKKDRKINKKEENILSEIKKGNLIKYNKEISKDVRLSGSTEELNSFKFIRDTLNSFGLQTDLTFEDEFISIPKSANLIIDDIEFPCITHSMSQSVVKREGKIISVEQTEFNKKDQTLENKIIICNGLARPESVKKAIDNKAIGMIFINDEYTHEMIVTPIWGHPTIYNYDLIPNIPIVSVNNMVGKEILKKIHSNSGCIISTNVETGFKQIPTLISNIEVSDNKEFVLFSGHVDSWHYGAMDNASSNALMIEVARVLQRNKNLLKRNIRFAFWSGHSHGRYAGSSKYADNYWHELNNKGMIHINVDSVGAKGANNLTEATCMPETKQLAYEVIKEITGQELVGSKFSKSGDQSFWGIGLPSLFMALSIQDNYDDMKNLKGSRGNTFGWWWHTTEDTLDKIDWNNLYRDTKIYLLTIFRSLTDCIIPIDCSASMENILFNLKKWQKDANSHIDLSASIQKSTYLLQKLNAFNKWLLFKNYANNLREINKTIMKLSKILVRLNYIEQDIFNQDLAMKSVPLPKLKLIQELKNTNINDEYYKYLRIVLLRKHNEILFMLNDAEELVLKLNAYMER